MSQFIDFGNGSAGSISAATGTINSYATMTGTSGSPTVTTSLSVSVGDQIFLHQSQGTGAGNWELVKVLSTGSGQFTADRNLVNTYGTGAQAVKIPQYSAGTCSNALSATAWDGSKGGILALICNGSVTLSGSIQVNGASGGYTDTQSTWATGGAGGGFRGGDAYRLNEGEANINSKQGESWPGVGGQSTAANAGGGGGAYIGAGVPNNRPEGGGAGHATSGVAGQTDDAAKSTPGSGGGTGSLANLTVMVYGSGGGGGSIIRNTGNNARLFAGDSGGGIIVLIAKQITITGSIQVNGYGGHSYIYPPDEVFGGAGSGGSVLIKAQIATLGSNLITATGGATNVGWTANGGAGGVGRIHLSYLTSYTGTTNPTLDTTQDPTLVVQTGGFFAFM